MSIHQLNIRGQDKVETAIRRLKQFEPDGGYYLAFSGGKDSVTVKALMDMAGVKYDAHYNYTTVDPPELVQFVKSIDGVSMDSSYYSDGKRITMWNLIPKKRMPPTRKVRYCCSYLKERGGQGRFSVTGVRREESFKRSHRAGLELSDTLTGPRDMYDPDNQSVEVIEACPTKAQRVLNPIIDWTKDEVWEFINEYHVPYCCLYDEGFERLGCVGCPMSGDKRYREFERWPKFYDAYIRAFARMLKGREEAGLKTEWRNGVEVMNWWMAR